jgi:multimeric flavodoxin WrbA
MKIACLLGSPRLKGNSATIAKRFCDVATGLNAEVRTFALNQLNYRGCQACMACKTKLDKCALKDDLAPVLDAVHESEILVIATPVYFGDISSQVKTFLDRTFSFLVPDFHSNPKPSRLTPKKKLVFIQTQGQPDEKLFAGIFPRYESIFRWYGFDGFHLIMGCGLNQPGDAEANDKIMKLAEETARKIINK